jgi:predicted dehydrogenase
MRIGLIGCGLISGAHVRGLAALGERAKLAVTCDLDLARAEQVAAEAGAERAVSDYREVLADPTIAAVDLLLPHHLHRRVTEEALAAGKHVLCEKPIATNLADADAMIAAAERAGRVLAVCEQCRHEPVVPAARELLDQGLIGEVIVVRALMAWFQGGGYLETAWRFDPETMGGGALVDGGHHRVDTLLELLGAPRRVTALTRRLRQVFPTEDTAVVLAEFESGILGELTVTQSTHWRPRVLFEAVGTEGALTARWDRLEVSSPRVPDGEAVYPLERRDGHAAALADFVTAVETGGRPRIDGPSARRDLAFVLAAYEAARTGRTVELD